MDTFVLLLGILIVVLVWRGPTTLPRLGAMLGRGVKQARRRFDSSKAERTDPDGPS